MTEQQPSSIAREAKGIQVGLKELLKSHSPWDKEVDFERKNLRRRYLSLLLVHPYAPESKDAETHLWMNTSYLFISCYKQKIHALDRVQQRGAQDPANRQRQGQAQGQGQSHGPVEHRKLVQRFRQFLADEEKFWGKFIARFRRSFALTEANAALLTLEIISVEDVVGDATDGPTEDHGRNHFQFPAEDTSVDLTPTTDADRRSRMVILSKAMTCLGDIARYREQYNESGGRPKAGHEDHPPSAKKNAGRGKRGGPELRRRNYERAQQCYEQARRLVPTEGNPSHQMAIIATYQKDVFSALLHNYRALCVLQPYDTAAENMGVILSKAMDQWRRSRRDDTADPPPHIQVERFKESVVVLHAMWRDKVDTRKHASAIYKNYRSLILQRNLPADTINAVVILSQGALWKHRMFEDPKPRRREEKQVEEGTAKGKRHDDPAFIETRIFMHLLDVHRALLEVGIEELKEPLPSDMPSNDLAQKITAAFRRTLAALRIASKWLIANYDYVAHGMEKDRARANEKGRTSTTPLVRFWTSYADFMRTLQRSFPVGNLPNLSAPLGEDLDLQGFLPLKQALLAQEPTSADSASSDNQGADGLSGEHPNVVQLMRISDLFSDANTIVAMEDSPIALYGNQFMVKGVEVATGQQQSSPSSAAIVVSSVLSSEVADEDVMTELTDDPVAEAFKHLEDGEDEILWDPRKSIATPEAAAVVTGEVDSLSATSPSLALSDTLSSQLAASIQQQYILPPPPRPASLTLPAVSPSSRTSVHLTQPPVHKPSTLANTISHSSSSAVQTTPTKVIGGVTTSPSIKPRGPAPGVTGDSRISPNTLPRTTLRPTMTTAEDLANSILNARAKSTVSGSISSAMSPAALLYGASYSRAGHSSIWTASKDEMTRRLGDGLQVGNRAPVGSMPNSGGRGIQISGIQPSNAASAVSGVQVHNLTPINNVAAIPASNGVPVSSSHSAFSLFQGQDQGPASYYTGASPPISHDVWPSSLASQTSQMMLPSGLSMPGASLSQSSLGVVHRRLPSASVTLGGHAAYSGLNIDALASHPGVRAPTNVSCDMYNVTPRLNPNLTSSISTPLGGMAAPLTNHVRHLSLRGAPPSLPPIYPSQSSMWGPSG